MAEGRRREAWDRLSALLSLIYNAFRSPKSPALGPEHFNPYLIEKARKAPKPVVGVEALKVFLTLAEQRKAAKPG